MTALRYVTTHTTYRTDPEELRHLIAVHARASAQLRASRGFCREFRANAVRLIERDIITLAVMHYRRNVPNIRAARALVEEAGR